MVRNPVPPPFRAILARPGTRPMVASACLGFVAVAAEPLAMLLLVRESTGSFAAAGLVVGAYAISSALIGPLRGRTLDRRGMRAIVPIALVHASAVTALIVAALADAPTVVLAALAVAAGAGYSPIFSAMRTLWSRFVTDRSELETAYALQAVLQEVSYVVGPLLAAAAIAGATPAVALGLSTGLMLVAGVTFAATPAARTWSASEKAAGSGGAVRSAGLRLLAATAVPTSAAFGITEVGLPAFAVREGSPATGGVLLSLFTLGSLVGGLWFGSRRWGGPLVGRYATVIVLLAAGLAVLASAPSLPIMAVLTLLAGAPIAPMMACRFQLIDAVAPRGTANEAFMWVSAAEAGGVSAGLALGGVLVDVSGTSIALLVAGGSAFVSAVVALAGREPLGGAVPGHARTP